MVVSWVWFLQCSGRCSYRFCSEDRLCVVSLVVMVGLILVSIVREVLLEGVRVGVIVDLCVMWGLVDDYYCVDFEVGVFWQVGYFDGGMGWEWGLEVVLYDSVDFGEFVQVGQVQVKVYDLVQ